jgi:pimeloyl-ACP methyl ester carboxylesterase
VQSPQTRYVQRGEVNIAYQVVGERGPALVIVPGFISHLDLQWMDPGYSHFLERLASFTRLILYDKPGTGLSDPIPNVPGPREHMSAGDRAFVQIARHAAAVLRLGSRLAGSKS